MRVAVSRHPDVEGASSEPNGKSYLRSKLHEVSLDMQPQIPLVFPLLKVGKAFLHFAEAGWTPLPLCFIASLTRS